MGVVGGRDKKSLNISLTLQFNMVNTMSLKKTVENYVMSAPVASIRYEKSMINKGWNETKKKSLKCALNMIIKSGLNKSEAIRILEGVKERTQEILVVLHNNKKK